MKDLRHYKEWGGIRCYRWKKGKTRIYLLTEYNSVYGELVSRFQIGELSTTNVKCKFTGNLLEFQECDSLCGERAFEKGSIIYEYLYLTLGLSDEGVPASGKDGWNKHYCNYYFIRKQLLSKGFIEVEK
jgi:hypothetical protein